MADSLSMVFHEACTASSHTAVRPASTALAWVLAEALDDDGVGHAAVCLQIPLVLPGV